MRRQQRLPTAGATTHGMDEVPGPQYSREDVTTGIVHFGVGGFHRAHQAMYLDRLMNEGKALDWGICGVGVMPADRADARRRWPRRTASTRWSSSTATARGSRASIGSIVEYLFAPDDPEAVIEKLAAPDDADRLADRHRGRLQPRRHVTGEFDADEPGRRGTTSSRARSPRTTFGLVTEALRAPARARASRRSRSCRATTSRATGTLARTAFTAFARLRDPELGDWIEREVRVPQLDGRPHHAGHHRRGPRASCASGSASRTAGRWCASRSPSGCSRTASPPGGRRYEDAGVQVVDDVEPYELMKLRLLNASHQALVLLRLPVPATGSCTRPRRTRCSRVPAAATWTRRRRRRCAPVPGRRPAPSTSAR